MSVWNGWHWEIFGAELKTETSIIRFPPHRLAKDTHEDGKPLLSLVGDWGFV